MPHAELTRLPPGGAARGRRETVPLTSSFAVPSGPLTAECFEWVLGALVQKLRDAGPLDGVYLALHGSMQVEGLSEAPEAVILRRAGRRWARGRSSR